MNFTQLAMHYAANHKRPVARAPATVNRKTEYGFLQRTLDTYQGAMQGKGWMTTERIGNLAGTDKWSAKDILKRMYKSGLVELDDTKKNDRGLPLYYWKWKE